MHYASLNPKQKDDNLNRNGFGTFDIETKDGLLGKDLFCWSAALPKPKTSNLQLIGGKSINSLSRLFKFLKERCANNKEDIDFIIYVHNLGFDIRFIEEFCINNNIEHKPILSGSKVIGFILDEFHVKFVDTFQFLFRSQEKCEKEWEIDQNLMKVNCLDIFQKKFSDWSIVDKNRLKLHNRNDVLALHQIMEKLRNYIFEITDVDMLYCITIASLSMKIFQTMLTRPIENPYLYFQKGVKNVEYGIDYEKYNFVKKSYFGGRNEVFDLNFHKNVKVIDKVSMYPNNMKKVMPIGIPYWVHSHNSIIEKINIRNEKGKWVSDKLCIIECSYEAPQDLKYPILGSKSEDKDSKLFGKYCFTNIDGNGTFCIPEILCALEHGYKIQMKKALVWDKSEKIFEPFIVKLYAIKQKNKGGRKNAGKILLNSLYGKFGQSIDRDNPLFLYCNSIEELMDKVIENEIETEIQPKFSEHFQKYYYITNQKAISTKLFQIMHLSSFITSYSRVELIEFIYKLDSLLYIGFNSKHQKVEKKIQINYTDSDSVAIDSNEQIDKLIEPLLGKELGCWDLDECYDEIKFLAPKGYFGLKYVYKLTQKEIDEKLEKGWCYMKNHKAICLIKLKGVDREALHKIISKSNSLKQIELRLKQPIRLLERYDTFRSSLRYGFALTTRKLTKHYSFEYAKRKVLEDKTTKAWDNSDVEKEQILEVLSCLTFMANIH